MSDAGWMDELGLRAIRQSRTEGLVRRIQADIDRSTLKKRQAAYTTWKLQAYKKDNLAYSKRALDAKQDQGAFNRRMLLLEMLLVLDSKPLNAKFTSLVSSQPPGQWPGFKDWARAWLKFEARVWREYDARREQAQARLEMHGVYDQKAPRCGPTPDRPAVVPLSTRGPKIYFVRDGGFVKIGRSATGAERRRDQLATGNPRELVLLGCIRGGVDNERELHTRFAALRVPGRKKEWFHLDGELRAWLEAVGLLKGDR